MNKYMISEQQNSLSGREPVVVLAKNLTCAKRHATKNQVFQGTILVIENEVGETLAVKERNGKWIEQSYFN